MQQPDGSGSGRVARSGRKLWEQLCRLRVGLPLLAIAYAAAYFMLPDENGMGPMGWWAWFDQSQYLLGAKAFAALDLSPSLHTYPPFYPFLGALFVQWSQQHPFWLINLACLLWFSAVFVLFASRYVSRSAAVILFLATVLFNHRVFPDFLIPWTTTPAVALLSVGLYGLLRWGGPEGERPGPARAVAASFGVSLAIGLLACLRPMDSLVGGVVWLGFMACAFRSCSQPPAAPVLFRKMVAAGLVGLPVGTAILLTFNYLVFGSITGGYVKAVSGTGFYPADLPEKFVSLFFDGYALYLEPRSGIAEHFPWIALGLLGTGFWLARGDWPLRTLAIALLAQFALYLPYTDLLPTGVWRFHNLHYFKWTFPYMALMAWLLVAHTWRTSRGGRIKLALRGAGLLGAAGLLMSLSLRIEREPVAGLTGRASAGTPAATVYSLRLKRQKTDLIDVPGLGGPFADVYFGKHKLWLNDRELVHVRDYRVLPAPWGVRILFIRPVEGDTLVFQPDEHLQGAPDRWLAGHYRFGLRIPLLPRSATGA